MILAMQNEVYGARLAAKYLDKELAGRFDNNSNIKQLSEQNASVITFTEAFSVWDHS